MAFQMSNEGQDDTPIWDGKGKGEWISTVQLSTFQHWSNWKSLDCKIKLSSALYNCLTTIGIYPGSTDTSQLQWRIRGIDTPRYLISSLNIYFRVLRTVLREIRFVSTRVATMKRQIYISLRLAHSIFGLTPPTPVVQTIVPSQWFGYVVARGSGSSVPRETSSVGYQSHQPYTHLLLCYIAGLKLRKDLALLWEWFSSIKGKPLILSITTFLRARSLTYLSPWVWPWGW